MEQAVNKNDSTLKILLGSFWPSFKMLRANDPLRLAGATAFFTTFALPPIVFILAQIFGIFVSAKAVGRGLVQNIGDNLGQQGATTVRRVIQSILTFSNNSYVIFFGSVFLVFVATTLFIVIRNSLNDFWRARRTKESGLLSNLAGRLRSFAVILIAGVLFFTNLFLKEMASLGGGYVRNIFGGGSLAFTLIVNEISGAAIVSAWFIVLFRFLSDARPRWKAAIAGGLMSGLLFIGGRVLLRALLANVGVLYGPSGSFVLVLLFVFYTSFILYFGACFTAVFSQKKGWPMRNAKADNEQEEKPEKKAQAATR